MTKSTTFLLARSRIPDLAAITARRTLVHKMGLGAELRGLSREDSWEIAHPAETDGRELVRRVVGVSTLLANPSKQAIRVGVGVLPDALPGPPGSRPFRIEVRDSDDESHRLAARLRDAFGIEEVEGLWRAVLWTLHLDPSLSEGRRDALVERVAVSRTRTVGLFANPHYQEVRFPDEPERGCRA